MSDVDTKALSGEWERISNRRLEIKEDMIMSFEGRSCNIVDRENNLVEHLKSDSGLVSSKVLAGYVLYILIARVKFEKTE